jgi:putative tricarboxylic transport membrane protein
VIAVAVAGLGASLVLRPGPAEDLGKTASRWRNLALALATLAFYVAALEPLGYLPATGMLLLAQMRWVEGRAWPVSLLTAVTAAGVSFVVFRLLLGVPLPAGVVPMPRW